MFFVNDKLHVLENRPAGSLVQHPRCVLHGVTAMMRGTRKSLFMVDETNSAGNGVIHVTVEHVDAFMATIEAEEVRFFFQMSVASVSNRIFILEIFCFLAEIA